jgi:hypothetical protein
VGEKQDVVVVVVKVVEEFEGEVVVQLGGKLKWK